MVAFRTPTGFAFNHGDSFSGTISGTLSAGDALVSDEKWFGASGSQIKAEVDKIGLEPSKIPGMDIISRLPVNHLFRNLFDSLFGSRNL